MERKRDIIYIMPKTTQRSLLYRKGKEYLPLVLHPFSININLASLKEYSDIITLQLAQANLVVMLNVQSVGGLPEPRGLVKVAQVAPEIGVVHDTPFVALERPGVKVRLRNYSIPPHPTLKCPT